MTTENYRAIKAELEKKTGELISDCQMFFAFSGDQFQSSKSVLKEGDKYVSFGMGAFLPLSNLEKFEQGQEALSQWKKDEIKKGNYQEQEILYELRNHEAFYCWSIESTVQALGGDYTEQEVWEVFNKYKHLETED